jgi:hypothetical protein
MANHYPFCQEWKDSVSHDSAAWREYVEVRACVGRFLAIACDAQRRDAVATWASHLAEVARISGTEVAQRINTLFCLIGAAEGPEIASELQLGAAPDGCAVFARLAVE